MTDPFLMNPGDGAEAAEAGYRHAEAFSIMTYRSDDGTEEERVWNSRDGVTPFVITLRSGKTAAHTDWNQDVRMPEGWCPPPGMRVFTDLTRERARRLAAVNVARWLENDRTSAHFRGVFGDDTARAVEEIAGASFKPGAPDLIDPAGQR